MKNIGLTVIVLVISLSVFSQSNEKAIKILEQRGEVYIRFNQSKVTDLKNLGQLMSINRISSIKNNNEITAYLNLKQFNQFKEEKIAFELLTPPSMLKSATMCADQGSVKGWACYPTYSQYVALMESFASDYPDLCELVEFGKSIDGRKLLAVKVSDNVGTKEEEPEFFYTSTMHGDETTGYALMLRLINYLLTNYGSDSRVTDLVNNTEIWINPLSNPDGTYYTSDNTVTGATRTNSNAIDLNRNFPDPVEGEHPDNKSWQQENIAMMDFMNNHNFTLAANFHGGAEVVNYPWDSWKSANKKHIDDAWYQKISREYADTVHANSTGYMTFLDNGITNGGDWYVVSGGRQDYVNYYLNGREVTIEISDTKLLDASLFNDLWNYNFRSLLNYINNVHKGIYGKVTDQDGKPIRAKISMAGHDADSSEVYSNSENGMYYRMLGTGDYQLVATKDGYAPAEFTITVSADSKFEQNIVLQKHPLGIGNYDVSIARVTKYKNPVLDQLNIDLELGMNLPFQVSLFDIYGKKLLNRQYHGIEGINNINLDISKYDAGTYLCKIHSKLFHKELKIIKLRY